MQASQDFQSEGLPRLEVNALENFIEVCLFYYLQSIVCLMKVLALTRTMLDQIVRHELDRLQDMRTK